MKHYIIANSEVADLDPSAPKTDLRLQGPLFHWLLCWDDNSHARSVVSYGTNLGLMRLMMGDLRIRAAIDNLNDVVRETDEDNINHRSLREFRARYDAALAKITEALDSADELFQQVRYRKSGELTWEEERAMKRAALATGMDQQEAASTTESSGSAIES